MESFFIYTGVNKNKNGCFLTDNSCFGCHLFSTYCLFHTQYIYQNNWITKQEEEEKKSWCAGQETQTTELYTALHSLQESWSLAPKPDKLYVLSPYGLVHDAKIIS